MENILIILSIIMIIMSLSSLIYKIKHLGVIIPTVVGLFILIISILSKFYIEYYYNMFTLLEIISLILFVLIFVCIIICNFTYPKTKNIDFNNYTLLVLGCRIRENRPSRMLKNRLDKALDILNKQQELKCVVSGGQGTDELYCESFIMKKYLINNGISENRIFEENQSTNTFTNLKNSKIVIEKNNLNKNIIIISDSFHLFRSYVYSKKLDINTCCIPCKTNLLVWFGYMFRELLGLAVYYIKYKKL